MNSSQYAREPSGVKQPIVIEYPLIVKNQKLSKFEKALEMVKTAYNQKFLPRPLKFPPGSKRQIGFSGSQKRLETQQSDSISNAINEMSPTDKITRMKTTILAEIDRRFNNSKTNQGYVFPRQPPENTKAQSSDSSLLSLEDKGVLNLHDQNTRYRLRGGGASADNKGSNINNQRTKVARKFGRNSLSEKNLVAVFYNEVEPDSFKEQERCFQKDYNCLRTGLDENHRDKRDYINKKERITANESDENNKSLTSRKDLSLNKPSFEWKDSLTEDLKRKIKLRLSQDKSHQTHMDFGKDNPPILQNQKAKVALGINISLGDTDPNYGLRTSLSTLNVRKSPYSQKIGIMKEYKRGTMREKLVNKPENSLDQRSLQNSWNITSININKTNIQYGFDKIGFPGVIEDKSEFLKKILDKKNSRSLYQRTQKKIIIRGGAKEPSYNTPVSQIFEDLTVINKPDERRVSHRRVKSLNKNEKIQNL